MQTWAEIGKQRQLSQRELAKKAHVSFRGIQVLEKEGHDWQDLINEPVMDVDPSGTGSVQIPEQLLENGRCLIGIVLLNVQEMLRLWLETGRGHHLGVLDGLPGKYKPPAHQSSSAVQDSTGVFNPSRIDFFIPGII